MSPSGMDISVLLARAAAILREEGATEVYVFGSFARGSPRADSDLDLAVVGLPDQRVIGALARLLSELGRLADVMQAEREPAFVRYLRSKGEFRRVA